MILVRKLKYCDGCPFFAVVQEDINTVLNTEHSLKCEHFDQCERVINLTKDEVENNG